MNVHRVSAAGKEQVIHIFRATEAFAEATLATEAGYPADARAIEPSQVLLIQKAAGFLALLQRQPELALRMLGSMSMHLRVLVGQLEDLTLKDVETRLANCPIKRCPDPVSAQPVAIELKMTKRVLAADSGPSVKPFLEPYEVSPTKAADGERKSGDSSLSGQIDDAAAAQFRRIAGVEATVLSRGRCS